MKILNDLDKLVDNVKRIHMVGIGGSGMYPLAQILRGKGYIISGSDNNESTSLAKIRELKIPVSMGHRRENIEDAELVVYSAAIAYDNPELEGARDKNIPTMERSYLLGALTRKFDTVIGVCGTHGKTTVSSMLTQILYLSDYDPTAVIGGRLPVIDGNGISGKSQYMVCEACEFVDTFLKLSPDIAVLLNIDNDHLDYFKTMENLAESFRKFISMAGKAVIVNGDDMLSMKAAAGTKAELITFGLSEESRYYAQNIKADSAGMEFDVMEKGGVLLHINMPVPGKHNVCNALAATAAAFYIGVPPEQIKNALASFRGAGRRFEMLGEFGGMTLADDFAHHPTELTATLNAAKAMGFDRVVAIFQPYTYSRTALLKDEFVKALSIADKVILTPIMAAREENIYNIYSEDIAEKLSDCICINSFEEVADYVEQNGKSKDLFVTMGGGDIYKAAYMIKERLGKIEQDS